MSNDAPQCFRIRPVTVEVGENSEGQKKALVLKDLSWEKQQALVRRVSQIMVQRDLLPAAIESLPVALQRKMADGVTDPAATLGAMINQMVELFQVLTSDQVVELLQMVTDNAITAEDVKAYNMGGGEILGLLQFALNRQLEPLKNFNASLSGMLSTKTAHSPK